MTTHRQGSFRLFRLTGIDVYLHWSWFAVAAYELTSRSARYSSLAWNVAEYVALFSIVLLHEFGHALACRQVGGTANQIVLWPLGGVAYVSPPQRPGAMLWSIAAGPLVNVVLLPLLGGCVLLAQAWGWPDLMPNGYGFLRDVCILNAVLLIFNLLPVYPLDGGQILRSLLWYVVGRARSLMVASIIGFVGAGLLGLGVVALVLAGNMHQAVWIGLMTVFMLVNCWGGLQQARLLARAAQLPRHAGAACPSCQAAPPIGAFWMCSRCQARFDTFVTLAACPQCGERFALTACLECGRQHPMQEWMLPPPPVPAGR